MSEMTMAEFVEELGITADATETGENPNMDDQNWQARHYKVELSRRDHGETLTIPFSMGMGLECEPDAETVLDCLASDSASIENARSFEDWAAELGYDADSRKAERTFKLCRDQAEALERWLAGVEVPDDEENGRILSHENGNDAYRVLLWEVERL